MSQVAAEGYRRLYRSAAIAGGRPGGGMCGFSFSRCAGEGAGGGWGQV